MGVYAEYLTRTNRSEKWRVTVTYSQPTWRHLAIKGLQKIFYAKPLMAVEPYLDEALEWFHHLRCDDDCVTGEMWSRNPDVTEPSPMGAGRKEWMKANGTYSQVTHCGRLPLAASIDVFNYHFSQKDRRTLYEYEGVREPLPECGPDYCTHADWTDDESLSASETVKRFQGLNPQPNTGSKA